jgi:hypothetical protein
MNRGYFDAVGGKGPLLLVCFTIPARRCSVSYGTYVLSFLGGVRFNAEAIHPGADQISSPTPVSYIFQYGR